MSMRIRTVKPEFWTHPVMAQLPAEAQLMAIALISWSDDHGYFEAEPRQVRGGVMPFRDDLGTIDRDLSTLSGVDFIEVRGTERGLIGRVVKFDSHQRVEKPKPSKLKPYFDTGCVIDASGTNPGRVTDESREEGKGREGEGEGEEEGPPPKSAGKKKLKGQVDLLPAPLPPPRPPTRIGKLHAFFLEQRECRFVLKPPHGLDLGEAPPDDPPDWGRSAAALAQWVKRWPGVESEEQDLRIRSVICAWLEIPYWVSPKPDKHTGKTTPYPWRALLHDEQFTEACAKAFPEEATA